MKSDDDNLFLARLLWQPGDLIEYRGGSVPVKARVTLVYKDVTGIFVAVRVTSRTHPLYQVNTELTFPWNDNNLYFRRHGIRSYHDDEF